MPTTSPVRVERVVARQARDAEVGELGHAGRALGPVGDDHVLGLDVAMDDSPLVGVLERVGEREADAHHVAVGQRAGGLQLGERGAADELGHQVVAVGVAARLVERDDARVVEPRRGERLALGPGVVAARAGNGLDRDLTVELLIVGEPHRAEPAGAETALEAVAPEHEGTLVGRRPGRRVRRPRRRRGEGLRRVHVTVDFCVRGRLPAPRGESHERIRPPGRAYFAPPRQGEALPLPSGRADDCRSSTRVTSRGRRGHEGPPVAWPPRPTRRPPA